MTEARELAALMVVCGACGELRGPFSMDMGRRGQTWMQECGCQPPRTPDEVLARRWPFRDFNTIAELCHGCVAEVIPSGSRFSRFFCDCCHERVVRINQRAGVPLIPAGRHSLMNGVFLRGGGPVRELDAFAGAVGTLFIRMERLRAWRRAAVRDQIAGMGLPPDATPPVEKLLAAAGNADRFHRMCVAVGVPEGILLDLSDQDLWQ